MSLSMQELQKILQEIWIFAASRVGNGARQALILLSPNQFSVPVPTQSPTGNRFYSPSPPQTGERRSPRGIEDLNLDQTLGKCSYVCVDNSVVYQTKWKLESKKKQKKKRKEKGMNEMKGTILTGLQHWQYGIHNSYPYTLGFIKKWNFNPYSNSFLN